MGAVFGTVVLTVLLHGVTSPVGAGPPAKGNPVEVRPRLVDPHPHDQVIDVNRPRTPFDCELPIGEDWYGSRTRCLAYLCGGRNVYNEFVFDADNRRRRNPCYGQNPTELPE